jgi:hypothetical protein
VIPPSRRVPLARALGAGLALALLLPPGAWTALAATAPARPDSTAPRRHLVSVRDSPGYVPLVDPESTSVAAGRRLNAPRVSMRFTHGLPSLEALARAICVGIHHEDQDTLFKLCVHSDEFCVVLWPEFPQSRPVTGLRWEDGWNTLYGRLFGGVRGAIRDHGGHVYQVLRVESTGTEMFRNFTLHDGITIVVKDDQGQVQRWTWLRSVAERKGAFEIYSTTD